MREKAVKAGTTLHEKKYGGYEESASNKIRQKERCRRRDYSIVDNISILTSF